MSSKIYDCITFFQENYMTNLRFSILNNFVDYFVICESKYDHRNNIKEFNFKLENQNLKKKIIYIQINEPFSSKNDLWENQANQRDKILTNINANEDDYIIFSDPDEIMSPNVLKNFSLKKKYGIFLQKHFMYKFNIVAEQYSPWEGSRVAKLKNLSSINYLRQKILKKNIKKWWRPDKEKSIELIENGGWHFNNFLSAEELSLKLKTFAHDEFSGDEYSNIEVIRKKIQKKEDLFGRGHFFKKIDENEYGILPDLILKNKDTFKNYFD